MANSEKELEEGLKRKVKELEAALAAPDDPEWLPEDKIFRAQARTLLAKLRK